MNEQSSPVEPPQIAGLHWRSLGLDDLASLVELAEHCRQVDGGLPFLNWPNYVGNRYFPDSVVASQGAFVDGTIVACASVSLGPPDQSQTARIAGQVRPEFSDRGLGRYLLDWSEAQAISRFDAATIQRKLEITTETLTDSTARLFASRGYECEMEGLVMQRDLDSDIPDIEPPSGIEFSNWTQALEPQFFEAYHAAFRARPGFPGFESPSEWIENWTDEDFEPAWSILATHGKQPVGFMTSSRNAPDGFVIQVGVIPDHRRRGLCSALLAEGMDRMRAAGMASMQLTVHTDNPGAIRAYETVGFRVIGRRARFSRILAS